MPRPREQMSDKERAVQDLEHIDALRRSEAFREYFERRQAEKVEALRLSVLIGEFSTPQALWEERIRYQQAVTMTEFMDQDETSVRGTLNLRSGESPVESALR